VSSGPVIKPFNHEPTARRKSLVAAALPVALFAAVVAQLTVVNRLPLPGGDAPDLVLLLVAAVAVTSNTMTAMLTGFAGGLALDIAPPVSHYAGEYALVFCLVGYLAARAMAAISAASGGAERDPSICLAVIAVAAAAGEAGQAGLGLLLSDPNVTDPAIRHVLPGAILYDLLLTPVVYWAVSLVAMLARPESERAPAPVFFGAQRLASVFRLASAGAAPNLRLAGTGAKYSGTRPVRREPKLRLADARSKSLARTNPAGTNSAPPLVAGGRAAKLNFAHSGRPHRAEGSDRTRPGRTPKLNFAAGRPAIAPRHPKGPGKGWLDSGGLKPPTVRRAKPGKGWLDDSRRKPPTVRRAKPGKGWLDDGRRKPPTVRRAKPGKGWLDSGRRRPPTAKRAKPGKGWLRPARPPRPNWYSNGPTTGWIHRSRAKDRWRTRRRSLPGSLLSTVRDLLPTGERR
jgi:rod shape-determining protein MreD